MTAMSPSLLRRAALLAVLSSTPPVWAASPDSPQGAAASPGAPDTSPAPESPSKSPLGTPAPGPSPSSETRDAKPESLAPSTAESSRCAPGPASELLAQGRQLQRQKGEGGAERALALYRAALEKDPTCVPALWEMGWSHQAKGDYDGAVAAWERLRKLSPAYPELDVQYAAVLARREQMAALRKLPEPGPLPAPELSPAEGPALTLRAVGDVNMGMAWPPERATLPPDEAMGLFAHVKPLLEDADVTFGNLETVLADSGASTKCGKKSNRCYAFRVPTSFAKALKDAGFDVMSLANNHAGDFGPEGRKATLAALEAVGLKHSGPLGDVASFEVKGRKVALVAFAFGADMYRIQEIDTGRRLVAFLAKRHDLVLVSFHAGAEGKGAEHVPNGPETFLGEDRGDSRAFAHAMVDAGADLLIGHGPHLLRALELYKGRLIAYSLGNFSSWEVFGLSPPNNISAILEVKLAPNGVALEAQVFPVVLERPGQPVRDPESRALPWIRSLSQADFGSPLLDEEGRWRRAASGSEKSP